MPMFRKYIHLWSIPYWVWGICTVLPQFLMHAGTGGVRRGLAECWYSHGFTGMQQKCGLSAGLSTQSSEQLINLKFEHSPACFSINPVLSVASSFFFLNASLHREESQKLYISQPRNHLTVDFTFDGPLCLSCQFHQQNWPTTKHVYPPSTAGK